MIHRYVVEFEDAVCFGYGETEQEAGEQATRYMKEVLSRAGRSVKGIGEVVKVTFDE